MGSGARVVVGCGVVCVRWWQEHRQELRGGTVSVSIDWQEV